MEHLILLNIAGLTGCHLNQLKNLPHFSEFLRKGVALPLCVSFPEVTCSVQATILSGCYPSEHGIIANGLYFRDSYTVSFWEQTASLVGKPRLWDLAKRSPRRLKTAVLFWQNILYAKADIVITPRPIHLEEGMIQWCYSKPVGYYEDLAEELGAFSLMDYWGPLASIKSSQWIMQAALATLERHLPNLLMVYLPQLDYSCQKYGPASEAVQRDLKELDSLLGSLFDTLDKLGLTSRTGLIIHSEYGFHDVRDSISPNKILRERGLLAVREIHGKEYLDLELSRALGMVDHQICHVYVQDGYLEQTREVLLHTPGIAKVMGQEEKKANHINHPRSGDLVLMSQPDSWFNYYWWEDSAKAPSFAHTVDIHRKPGYDPVELFFDPVGRRIPLKPELIKGSHGRISEDKEEMALCLIDGEIGQKLNDLPEVIEATRIAPTVARLLGFEGDFLAPSLL